MTCHPHLLAGGTAAEKKARTDLKGGFQWSALEKMSCSFSNCQL